MSFDTLIQLALAVAHMTLALMLWQRSMPRLLDARGRWHSICAWLLGMVLAIGGTALLAAALADAPANWVLISKDIALAGYGVCRYRRSMELSQATWRTCRLPEKEALSCSRK